MLTSLFHPTVKYDDLFGSSKSYGGSLLFSIVPQWRRDKKIDQAEQGRQYVLPGAAGEPCCLLSAGSPKPLETALSCAFLLPWSALF